MGTQSADSETVHVRMSRPGSTRPVLPDRDVSLGLSPSRWYGAPAPGGLGLPAAMPTANQLYAPRGVWLDDERLIVADTGNHRMMIWFDPAAASHSPADVVIGQPDFGTEGAQAGGTGPELGLRLPTGVIVYEGRLVVADAWNHRVLVWDRIPEAPNVAPDMVLGQPDRRSVNENRGGACGLNTMYWPYGVAVIGDRFYVADTGNRRVLGWPSIPEPDQVPDLVLGQPDATTREENRGGIGPATFRWPHDLAGNPEITVIADAGNHRLLGWKPRPDKDRPADTLFGQVDFESAVEFPYGPQGPSAMRFPYAISLDRVPVEASPLLAVADTANNRVLLWNQVPLDSHVDADGVLGQHEFDSNGENRWEMVAEDTFCWPYGLLLHRGRLAVADSGNNRVVVWDRA